MLKSEVTATSNRVSLGLKCSECIHFSKGPAKFEKLCSQMGVETFSEACREYTPDITKLASADGQRIKLLGDLVSTLNGPQIRILAYTFRNLDYLKKTGLAFGQTVVFSISGAEILSNYVRGQVIGCDKTGETIYITSNLDKLNGKNNASISLLRPAVLTVTEYKAKRSALVKEGRIAEPEPKPGSNKRTILQCLKMDQDTYEVFRMTLEQTPEDYKPPQLDVVPADWIDARSVSKIIDSGKIGKDIKKSKKVKTNGKPLSGVVRAIKKSTTNAGPVAPAVSTTGKKSSSSKVFKIERYGNTNSPKR